MTDYSYLISLLGIALSVATFLIGRMTASRQQGKADGQMQTMLANWLRCVMSVYERMGGK